MTGGLSSADLRRTGTTTLATAWVVLLVASVTLWGLVPGLVVGGWVAPIVVALLGWAAHVIRERVQRRHESSEVVTIDLRRQSAG